MRSNPDRALLKRFFSGLAEYTFHTQLGIADPPLVDYLAGMLTRFIRYEAIYRVRNATGKTLAEVAEMMVESEQRVGDARREVHRHIGDFTLFWSGVYPESLARLQRPDQTDSLLDYCAQGKRAYYIASTIRGANNEDECDVLERLSARFELCMYGLGEIRREWERHDPDSPGDARAILIN